MAPFKRALFGYRCADVDAAIGERDAALTDRDGQIAERDGQIGVLHGEIARGAAQMAASERETTELAAMVIEREREIHVLGQRLREANEVHDRSIAALDAVTARLEEMQAQARGQATRIRMKALREAVEVSKRVQALTDAQEGTQESLAAPANGSAPTNGSTPEANGIFEGFYEGDVKLEIGPFGDFSQLVGFEDAIGASGASDVTIDRFSDGRASLSMHFEEPVDLLHELEEHSALEFKVRHTAPDNLILDVDEDGSGEQFAA